VQGSAWRRTQNKTIVICCDGTNNKFGVTTVIDDGELFEGINDLIGGDTAPSAAAPN
jgi:uncharacterized protein (DUF2235 family)